WNPPRGRDDGPCPGPPGLLVAGPDGTLRRRGGPRGPWAPSPVRGRVECPSLVRRPRGRRDRPREMAVPPIPRNGRAAGRDHRGPGKPGGRGRRSPGEETHPATDRIDPPEAGADRGGTGMKRIPTKMEGLDDVLGGGIPDGGVVLVSGAPGTMKTSLTYHILHENALDGVRGLYVSLEQSR